MVWRLQRVLPQVPSTDSESSWEDRWCLSPLPPGHLPPVSPASPQHCRWSHHPDTQLLQSAAIREETAESPGEDQQTEGQLHPSGCQEAELPPVLAPPPLFYPTQLWTLTLPPPPPLTNCDPHQSLCAALEWSLPHPALSVIYLFWQSDKRLFFFLHYSHLHSFVLFNWFALYLPCALCHFISFLFCIVLQCPYLYSLYVHMVKLYLSVFECLLSVFNVNWMHQGSENNAISILCMYVLYMWKNWQFDLTLAILKVFMKHYFSGGFLQHM